jgi:hypothetical protein
MVSLGGALERLSPPWLLREVTVTVMVAVSASWVDVFGRISLGAS